MSLLPDDGVPTYARVLRLRNIRPGALACFALFEGVIALAVLLALAEMASWWIVILLPLAMAMFVKLDDLLVGVISGSPVVVPIGYGSPDLRTADLGSPGPAAVNQRAARWDRPAVLARWRARRILRPTAFPINTGLLGGGPLALGLLGRGSSGRRLLGRRLFGRDSSGRDSSGRRLLGRRLLGRDSSGRRLLARGSLVRGSLGRGLLGRGLLGQRLLGRGFVGRRLLGRRVDPAVSGDQPERIWPVPAGMVGAAGTIYRSRYAGPGVSPLESGLPEGIDGSPREGQGASASEDRGGGEGGRANRGSHVDQDANRQPVRPPEWAESTPRVGFLNDRVTRPVHDDDGDCRHRRSGINQGRFG